jgi:hypothetical protein
VFFLILSCLNNLSYALFNESLTVSPLEDGHVLVSVEFAVEHHEDLAHSGSDFSYIRAQFLGYI